MKYAVYENLHGRRRIVGLHKTKTAAFKSMNTKSKKFYKDGIAEVSDDARKGGLVENFIIKTESAC